MYASEVFFSYQYERDQMRVVKIRDLWLSSVGEEAKGFWDRSTFEDAKIQGTQAIHSWIDEQLKGTVLTVLLIGLETYITEYIDYTIEQSCQQGNAFLGIEVNRLPDRGGSTDLLGKNPLCKYLIDSKTNTFLSDISTTYSWHKDNGEENFIKWIEEAAKVVSG